MIFRAFRGPANVRDCRYDADLQKKLIYFRASHLYTQKSCQSQIRANTFFSGKTVYSKI